MEQQSNNLKPLPQNTPVPAQPVQQQGSMKTTHHNSYILIVVFASLVVMSFGGSGYLLSILPKKATAVQKLRTQALSMQMSEQDEQLLNKTLKDTEESRNQLLAAFPTEASLLDFIRVIDTLRGSDVEVIRYSVDSDVPTKIGKNPRFLPMSLVLRGSSDAVDRALATIMKSPYFIRTVAFTKDYDPVKNQVTVQTQFHLFVADAFTKTNP